MRTRPARECGRSLVSYRCSHFVSCLHPGMTHPSSDIIGCRCCLNSQRKYVGIESVAKYQGPTNSEMVMLRGKKKMTWQIIKLNRERTALVTVIPGLHHSFFTCPSMQGPNLGDCC